jgi:DhnA family fructose-bisphosphate aldolase class Ia
LKQYRLNRLFNPASGRCLDVAVDHGVFGQSEHLAGIEDLNSVVGVLVEAAPDAIQLSVGHADLLQSKPGKAKPALVLRVDVANIYAQSAGSQTFSLISEDAALQAVRLDAACVVVNLFDVDGQPDLRRACIANILALKSACDDVAIPLMIEPLAMRHADQGALAVDADVERIVGIVRQAAELGADVIKADPTDDLSAYHRVVEAASVPLLVRGGGRIGDEEILLRTKAVLDQGAAGIVYGRNIVQRPSPVLMTRALMAVVHDGATAAQALQLMREAA